jgi:conjugal transfer pilus assembly protein TraV
MKHYFLTAAFLATTACGVGNTESDFLCAAQIGSPCSTIAQADGRGSTSNTPITERAEDTAMDSLSQDPLGTGKVTGPFGEMPDGGFGYQSGRYRVPEVTGRLWIAPYLDENQILHESRYVHFVIVDAHWSQR